jgi:cell fate (sporulation/competence/biofilm development) regulator YlbF (YheA/YmcA/DUF963 family)
MAFTDQSTATPRVVEAAEVLACLLTETEELQDFVRSARIVQLDREVNEILGLINGYYDEDIAQSTSLLELEERLESLPVMKEYHQAEQSVRGIFTAVDQIISSAAGLAFAENAQPSACG